MAAKLYTIAPDRPFASTLARTILAEDGHDPQSLPRRLILLPTRRACRAVREAFLAQSGGRPLLLPRLQPLGDVDADELALSAPELDLGLPPAIPPLRRLLLLSRLIAAGEGGTLRAERHIPLARALCRLMDQVYTENLDLSALPRLVDGTEFAAHWQITVDFLSILSVHWPSILAESGMMDAADRRNRLLGALADHWERSPPDYPVIAAGSTGSIPATARLLGVIASLPTGAVILPGLDKDMDAAAWDHLDDTHPQRTLKHLLSTMGCAPEDVREWPQGTEYKPSARVRLAGELMRPAETAESWQSLHWPHGQVAAALDGLHYIEAPSPQAETEAIALLLRETLEEPEKTALVITPDRALGARIAAAMEKWGVTLDDSAGNPLAHSAAARFFLGIADMAANGLRPASLLAVLKHPLNRAFEADFVNALERGLLRGLPPAPGPDGLVDTCRQRLADKDDRRRPPEGLLDGLRTLQNILSPFYDFHAGEEACVADMLAAHIGVAEALSDPALLWRGEDGETLASFLSQLREQMDGLPPVSPADYAVLLREFMNGTPLRPAYGTHPRLTILGQIEARLIHADRLILAGLNEGTWPPQPGSDPFLSRPMKRDFGLPPPERAIGLAAHDFVQAFGGREVYLTRAQKTDGAPTIPARWIARLETVLSALGTDIARLRRPEIAGWAVEYHHVPDNMVRPASRPAPRPPAAARPDKLSVTKVDTWLRDPYGIYARYILKLPRLDELEEEPDAAARGTLFHAVLERFVAQTAADRRLPPHAEDIFLSIAREELPRHIPSAGQRALVWPRLVRLAGWFIAQEARWRASGASPILREAYGTLAMAVPGRDRPFTLTGIADRIDRLAEGSAAIIDYKTGGSGLSKGGIKAGKLPQLPLEALMLEQGAFAGMERIKTGTLSYWVVSGGREPGKAEALDDAAQIEAAVRAVEAALHELVRLFDDPQTPYFSLPMPARAPRFNDYAHLARVQEWTALDEAAEG